jgi:hypothetical protein
MMTDTVTVGWVVWFLRLRRLLETGKAVTTVSAFRIGNQRGYDLSLIGAIPVQCTAQFLGLRMRTMHLNLGRGPKVRRPYKILPETRRDVAQAWGTGH